MKKYIHITKEDREFIMKALGVTERMVFKGIRYESDTDTARRIRRLALCRGGMVMNVVAETETFHDSDHYMRQYLPNGAMLELNKRDGSGDVIFKGCSVRHYSHLMVSDIPGIQQWAGSLR